MWLVVVCKVVVVPSHKICKKYVIHDRIFCTENKVTPPYFWYKKYFVWDFCIVKILKRKEKKFNR